MAILVREAAQAGAYHLLGTLFGSLAKGQEPTASAPDVDGRLEQALGFCRALGWGSFSAPSFVQGKSLVLTSPLTPEIAYYATRHGATVRGRLVFQQGLALAVLRLLMGGLGTGPDAPLLPYAEALRRWPALEVTETRSPLRGDAVCEVTAGLVG